MFATLPESRRRVERSPLQILTSLAIHAGLLVGAIEVTEGAAELITSHRADPLAIYVPTAARQLPAPAPQATTAQTLSASPAALSALAPPTDVPLGIPSVDLGAAIDPAHRFGVGGGEQPGSELGAARFGAGVGGTELSHFSAAEVDVPVSYLGGGEPVYPAALKRAGITGEVTLQFVVDTAGRVEPASVRVIGRLDRGFESAAREAILRARFSAASVRGRVVRQLVQQRMVFEVGR